MSYIEALKKVLVKYEDLDNTESGYWDLVTDSHVGELFHASDLTQALYRYHDNWDSPDDCLAFLDSYSAWVEKVEAAKKTYDRDSGNLQKLFRFGETIRIFRMLLKNPKPNRRLLFQHCIALSQQFDYDTIGDPAEHRAAASFFKSDFSRRNIKHAWKCIQYLLSAYHDHVRRMGAQTYFSRNNPKRYFQLFVQSKDIAFPVVFVQQDTGNGLQRGSLEECRIWLDVQLGSEKRSSGKVNLIALNSGDGRTPYEDRIIGETIEKATLEAVDCYNRYQPAGGGNQVVRSVFFQIGRFDRDYDGASIACVAFIATLTRLSGRHLPHSVFYTGKLGCDDNAIEGIAAKAVAGWNSGFHTFVFPRENLDELTENLGKQNIPYRVYEKGQPVVSEKRGIVCPYQSIDDLYGIWEDLTVSQRSVSPRTIGRSIHNLSLRNKHFTGRKKFFDRLSKRFDSETTMMVLSGLGGVGKTEISMEYAYRFRRKYSLIWRIRGEELSSIVIDYAELAQKLDLPQKGIREEDVVLDGVREWLENHSGWLLIFDNVENPGILFNDDLPILPRGGGGHVLITSRYQDWDEWCEHIPVRKFENEESVQFLINRTGQRNRQAAEHLAKKLGHLPLALAQAAAYIRKQEVGLEEYLELFVNRRKNLWNVENAPRNYPFTVATTWNIAMAKISREQPLAVDLLNFISLQAPDDIPVKLLLRDEAFQEGKFSVDIANRLAALTPDSGTFVKIRDRLRTRLLQGKQNQIVSLVKNAQEPFVYDNVISALKSYSLVEGNLDSLSMHNLVQVVTRDNLSPRQLDQWIETTLQLTDRIFPFNSGDLKNWPLCSRLFPHAVTLVETARQKNTLPETTLSLLNKLGDYLYATAQYAKAVEIQEQALGIAEKHYPGPDPGLSRTTRSLGLSLEAQDSFDEALKFYRKALQIDRELFGSQHLEIAQDLDCLGDVSLKQGKLDDALGYFKSSLECSQGAFNERHYSVAVGRNNLGRTFMARGNFKNALEHFDKALEIARDWHGHNHPFVAEVINNLGDIHLQRGNLQRAKEDFTTAFHIDQGFFGQDHPQVALDLNKLGLVDLARNELPGAEKQFQQALEIDRKTYGNQHHSLARDYNSFGRLEKAKGNLPAAIDYFRKALVTAKSVYRTARHPFIADIAANYGYAVLERKNFEEARKYIELALDINRKSYSPTHPLVARAINNLGRVYHLEQKLDVAQKHYFNAYDILMKHFVKNHPDVMDVRKNLLKLADDFNQQALEKNPSKQQLYCPQTQTIHRKLEVAG